MSALALSARALVDPVGAVPPLVARKVWFVPLLVLALAVASSQVAIGLRLHVEPQVIAELSKAGDLAKQSERDIEEAVETAQRVALVSGAAKGLMATPLIALLLAAALRFVAWLLNRKTTFMACFSAICVCLLPIAVYHLTLAFMAFRQPLLLPRQVPTLLTSSLAPWLASVPSRFASLVDALDFFRLWSVGLLGLGLTQAFSLSKTKAFVFALVLFVLFTLTFFVGLPAIAAAGGA